MGLEEGIKSLIMDWEVLKACDKVIRRLILKAEKNEFIGRVAERFKKGNPGHS